jgi:hypothetical protein
VVPRDIWFGSATECVAYLGSRVDDMFTARGSCYHLPRRESKGEARAVEQAHEAEEVRGGMHAARPSQLMCGVFDGGRR